MRHLTVLITAELIAVDRGGWCRSCALPSLLTAHLVLTLHGAPTHIFSVTHCTDCGQTTY